MFAEQLKACYGVGQLSKQANNLIKAHDRLPLDVTNTVIANGLWYHTNGGVVSTFKW